MGDLDIDADFEIPGDGESAPVVRVAEVEGRRAGCIEERLAVGSAEEGDLGGRAAEIAGENLAHSGMGADPVSAVERGAESLGAAVLAGVENGEFSVLKRMGCELPYPDVDGAGGEPPWAGLGKGRGLVGSRHVSIPTRDPARVRRGAGG